MAVVIWNSSPDWTAELYEQTAAKAWEGTTIPEELPEGFVAHLSLPLPGGGWQVLDVWESQEAAQSFMETRVLPAAGSIDAPPFDSVVLEAHTVITHAVVSR